MFAVEKSAGHPAQFVADQQHQGLHRGLIALAPADEQLSDTLRTA